LTSDERYSRQVLFAGIGEAGQARLRESSIAIVGSGATGSAAAATLVRAGVGRIRIIDRDYVEASNLQRQALFDEQDAAESIPKAIAAERKLRSFSSDVRAEGKVADLTPANVHELLADAQVVLDGTDNFETRYLINDYAVKNRVPWIYAAAVGSYGATMNVVPGETACLACIFPEPPRGVLETCDTAGILGSVVQAVAAVQVTEAVKLLVGANSELRRTLLALDLWSNQRSEIAADRPRSDCRVCGKGEYRHLDGAVRAQVTLCGRNSVQIHERQRAMDFEELSARLAPHGAVRHNEFVLKFQREPLELTLFRDGRAIIKGTTDATVARSLYARYIGS
jgi:molybdopterin-synthase adenylyltransferase